MSLLLSGPLLSPASFIPGPWTFWFFVSRLGEAQILLPAMAGALLWLVLQPRCRPLAAVWLAAVTAAAALTTASKVAFIGYELGYAPLDYSGISGHAMFAAAILPVLLRVQFANAAPRRAAFASAAGYALALLVAVSRLKLGAHSVADVVLGGSLGVLASTWALRFWPAGPQRPPIWLPAALALWLVMLPAAAPPSNTHGLVTALALEISGRPFPYTRYEMLRRYQQRASRVAGVQPQFAAAVVPLQPPGQRQR